jgi:hypothetical protein
MVFWLMTMSGGYVYRMLELCRVVINCAIYLSQSFMTVVPLILLLYGYNFGHRSVMTFVGLYNKKTFAKTPQKRMSLTMAYTSLINISAAPVEIRDWSTGQQCLSLSKIGLFMLEIA